MSWIAIEDASSAFERPAWAVDKMVQEGKLEKRVDAGGRVFVRRPPGIEELADALAPFLPDEVVPVVAELIDEDGEPAAGPSREEMMLRALWKLLEKQQAQIAEIRELAARPPLLLPAPPQPAPKKPAPPVAVLVLAGLLAVIGAASFFFTQDGIEKERERTERALDHAAMLARELRDVRAAPVGTGTLPAGFRRR